LLTTKRPTQTNPAKPMAVEVKPQRLTVDLDPDLHRKLKVQAAQESRSISDIIRTAAEQYVTSQG